MICDGHVPTSLSVSINFPPPHTLVKIVSCAIICVSVCLVLRLMCVHACPCIHPNPSPPSWVPHYPFMSVRAHICFFREISRPWMHTSKSYPAHSFCLVSSCLFLCVSVVAPHRTHLHLCAPMCTHMHPTAPVHTPDVLHYMCFSVLA